MSGDVGTALYRLSLPLKQRWPRRGSGSRARPPALHPNRSSGDRLARRDQRERIRRPRRAPCPDCATGGSPFPRRRRRPASGQRRDWRAGAEIVDDRAVIESGRCRLADLPFHELAPPVARHPPELLRRDGSNCGGHHSDHIGEVNPCVPLPLRHDRCRIPVRATAPNRGKRSRGTSSRCAGRTTENAPDLEAQAETPPISRVSGGPAGKTGRAGSPSQPRAIRPGDIRPKRQPQLTNSGAAIARGRPRRLQPFGGWVVRDNSGIARQVDRARETFARWAAPARSSAM